jgi:VanZ family protein
MINRLVRLVQPFAGWLFITWFVAIIILSFLPSVGKTTSVDIGKIEIRLDYLYHIIIYLSGTILAILYAVPSPKFPAKSSFLRTMLAVSFMILLALLLEYIQKLIPSRTFNINDIISNLMGVLLGTVLTIILLLRKQLPNKYYPR